MNELDHSSSLKRYIYLRRYSRMRSIFMDVGLVGGFWGPTSNDSSLWSQSLALSLSRSFLVLASSSSLFFLILPSFSRAVLSSCFSRVIACRSSFKMANLSSLSLMPALASLSSFLSYWLSVLTASFSCDNLQFSLVTNPMVSLIRINLSYSSYTNFRLTICCSSLAACSCQRLSLATPTSYAILFSTLRIKFQYSRVLSLDQPTERLASSPARLRYSYRLAFSLRAVASFIYRSSIRDRALAYQPWMRQFNAFSLRAKSYTNIFSRWRTLSNFRLQFVYISAAQAWNLILHSSPVLTFILWAQNSLKRANSFSQYAFSSRQLCVPDGVRMGWFLSCSTRLNSRSITANFSSMEREDDWWTVWHQACLRKLFSLESLPKRYYTMGREESTSGRFKIYVTSRRQSMRSQQPLSALKTEEAQVHPM